MNNGRSKSKRCLAAVLALAGLATTAAAIDTAPVAPDKQNNLSELREWLNRRNQERKQLGTAVPEIPKHRHAPATPPLAKTQPGEAAQAPAKPGPDIGRGPDGRIRHRLVINDEGPDQLQVYSDSGYAPAPHGNAAQDEAHLARLTPRGRQVWMSGKFLREPPSPRLKPRP